MLETTLPELEVEIPVLDTEGEKDAELLPETEDVLNIRDPASVKTAISRG